MQFQKISILTPWKVNGNSEGVGGLESQNFKRNVLNLTGISSGVGGLKQKNLPWEGDGYFLEQHNIQEESELIIRQTFTTIHSFTEEVL